MSNSRRPERSSVVTASPFSSQPSGGGSRSDYERCSYWLRFQDLCHKRPEKRDEPGTSLLQYFSGNLARLIILCHDSNNRTPIQQSSTVLFEIIRISIAHFYSGCKQFRKEPLFSSGRVEFLSVFYPGQNTDLIRRKSVSVQDSDYLFC